MVRTGNNNSDHMGVIPYGIKIILIFPIEIFIFIIFNDAIQALYSINNKN